MQLQNFDAGFYGDYILFLLFFPSEIFIVGFINLIVEIYGDYFPFKFLCLLLL